jgi:hypothetical protein
MRLDKSAATLTLTAFDTNSINRVLIAIQGRLDQLEGIGQVSEVRNSMDVSGGLTLGGLLDAFGVNVPGADQYKVRNLPLVLQTFKVGSYYFNAGNDPAVDLGYGTWVRAFEGKFLVSQKDGDPDFGTGGSEGGSKTHTHSTDIASFTSANSTSVASVAAGGGMTVAAHPHSHGVDPPATTSGDNSALPPFGVLYVWLRTA